MKAPSNWDYRIGRRVRLRDLHILLTVIERGSMAKAAAYLGVTQPAISDAIATLEAALGVRLLNRDRRGVEPTVYGSTLIKYGRAAIDNLRQGVKEIEFLADPTAGELRVGCPESVATGPLVPIIERLTARHPRVRLKVEQFNTPVFEFPQLERREVDLILARLNPMPGNAHLRRFNVEILFDDRFCLAVSKRSPLARARRVDLPDLLKERWIMTPPESPGGAAILKAFIDRGLTPPEAAITTFSVHLRNALTSAGHFVTALPASVLRLHTDVLQELPVPLPMPKWPVAIVTLKDREMNPAAHVFIACAREAAKAIMKVAPVRARLDGNKRAATAGQQT